MDTLGVSIREEVFPGGSLTASWRGRSTPGPNMPQLGSSPARPPASPPARRAGVGISLMPIVRATPSAHSSQRETEGAGGDGRPPNHLGPPHGLLELHQPLLVLVALHEHTGHLHPREATTLCHGDLVLQGRALPFSRRRAGQRLSPARSEVSSCHASSPSRPPDSHRPSGKRGGEDIRGGYPPPKGHSFQKVT